MNLLKRITKHLIHCTWPVYCNSTMKKFLSIFEQMLFKALINSQIYIYVLYRQIINTHKAKIVRIFAYRPCLSRLEYMQLCILSLTAISIEEGFIQKARQIVVVAFKTAR